MPKRSGVLCDCYKDACDSSRSIPIFRFARLRPAMTALKLLWLCSCCLPGKAECRPKVLE